MNRRTAIAAAVASPGAALGNPMPVRDFIAREGAEAVFARLVARSQANDRDAAGWLLLVRRAGVPSCLASACLDLGLATLGQVDAFVQRCGLSYAEVDGLFPVVSAKLVLPMLMWPIIHFQATQQFALPSVGDPGLLKVRNSDRAYRPVPLAVIREAAGKFPQRDADFSRTANCEDKVYSFRGWLASQGILDAAVGLAGLFLYQWGQYQLTHAVVAAIDENQKFWLIDGGVYPADFAKFRGMEHCTSNKLMWLDF